MSARPGAGRSVAGLVHRWSVRAFALAWVVALGLYAIGTFGLFGQQRDPLAGIFLIPLGLPWSRLVDRAPEALWPLLAAAAPLINLVLLVALGRFVAGWEPARRSQR